MLLIYIIYVLIAPKFNILAYSKDIIVNENVKDETNIIKKVSLDRGACESISIILDAIEYYRTSVGNVENNIVESYLLHIERLDVIDYMLGKLDNYYPSGFT